MSVAEASIEFDDPAELGGWRVSQGEPMDSGSTTFSISDGLLKVAAAQTEWIDRKHGASVGRTIHGNLVVTIVDPAALIDQLGD